MDINYWLIECMGYVGAVSLVIAFLCVSSGKWEGRGFKYNSLNLFAAVIYGIYAIIKEVPPVLILQIFWGVISITALVKLTKASKG